MPKAAANWNQESHKITNSTIPRTKDKNINSNNKWIDQWEEAICHMTTNTSNLRLVSTINLAANKKMRAKWWEVAVPIGVNISSCLNKWWYHWHLCLLFRKRQENLTRESKKEDFRREWTLTRWFKMSRICFRALWLSLLKVIKVISLSCRSLLLGGLNVSISILGLIGLFSFLMISNNYSRP